MRSSHIHNSVWSSEAHLFAAACLWLFYTRSIATLSLRKKQKQLSVIYLGTTTVTGTPICHDVLLYDQVVPPACTSDVEEFQHVYSRPGINLNLTSINEQLLWLPASIWALALGKYWTYVNRWDSGELVTFHSLYSSCLAPFTHAMVVTCLANSSSHHHDFAYMWIRYRLCNTYPLLHIYMMKFLGTHSEAAMIGFAWFCHVQVLINDQVIFESIQTEGQYLHCSANFLGRTGQQLHSK